MGLAYRASIFSAVFRRTFDQAQGRGLAIQSEPDLDRFRNQARRAADTLPSSRKLEPPIIESNPSCQLTTRSTLFPWWGVDLAISSDATSASWFHSAFLPKTPVPSRRRKVTKFEGHPFEQKSCPNLLTSCRTQKHSRPCAAQFTGTGSSLPYGKQPQGIAEDLL